MCFGGEHACPHEDVGGTDAYLELVEAVWGPRHPRYREMTDWLELRGYEGPFDPEVFDLAAVNANRRKAVKGPPKPNDALRG